MRSASVGGRGVGAGRGLDLDTVLCAVAAMTSAGAGLLHLLAARDHLVHVPVAALFVALAVAQLAWAAGVAWTHSRYLLKLGALLNLGVIATWVVSRTSGIGFIEMVSDPEPVGVADATATLFEVLLVAIVGLLAILPAEARRARLTPVRSRRLLAGVGALALLLVVPGFLTPGGGHGHDDVHVLGATETNAHAHDGGAHTNRTSASRSHDHMDAASAAEPHPHAEDATSTAHGHAPSAGGGTASSHEHAAGDASEAGHAHDGGSGSQTLAAPPAPEPRGTVASVRYGPFLLPPVDNGGDAHYNRIIPVAAPCVNCLITSMEPDLVFADGKAANLDSGPMLHHAVLTNPFENDPTCGRDFGIGGLGRRVFAAGNERTRMIMPSGFGVENRSPTWMGIFEIMNDAPASHVVFFDLTITHVPASDPATKPVVPVWLDVDNCNDSQFAVPKGESHTIWKWKSSMTGRIVGAGGHVHDGGVYMTLSNATTGKRMCTSWAGYGTKPAFMGTIESMSTCLYDRIGTVRAGESLQIDTYYNSSRAADDVMGILLAYVYETNDLAGGSPPPAAYTQAPPRSAPPPSGGGHSH